MSVVELSSHRKSGQSVTMSRPPLHDQVTAEAIMERLEAVNDRLDGVSKDTREARDATISLNARLTAENTQEQITQIWARMEKSDAAHRADLQNAYARLAEAAALRSKELDLDREAWKRRVENLEAWRNRIEGGSGLLGWISKHAPWLVTVAVAALALFKVKVS